VCRWSAQRWSQKSPVHSLSAEEWWWASSAHSVHSQIVSYLRLVMKNEMKVSTFCWWFRTWQPQHDSPSVTHQASRSDCLHCSLTPWAIRSYLDDCCSVFEKLHKTNYSNQTHDTTS
jgi:hypothetical protein